MSLSDIARACEDNDETKFATITGQYNWFNSINNNIDIKELGGRKQYLSCKTTVLCIASQFSSGYFVKKLLDNGASTKLTDGFCDTALHSACRSFLDVLYKVDLLVSNDKDLLNRCNARGNTPLHIAVLNRDHTVPQRLLQEGANVNAVSRKGITPLHIASYYGLENVVDVLLLRPDVDVNIQDENGDTALHQAAGNSHLRIIQKLKQSPKCNPALRNRDGFTADQENPINMELLEKAQQGSAVEVQILIDSGAICISDLFGDTPLHKACISRSEEVKKAKILLSFDNTQINAQNRRKHLPIHIAAEKENVRLLKLLINKMDRHILASQHPILLRIAMRLGNMHIVKLLLDNNVNAEILDGCMRKTTVLCFASLHSTATFLEELLCCGASINSVDSIGDTALHKACRSVTDPKKKVEMLLKEDSSLITRCNDNEVTPLHVAARISDHTIATMLLEKGADVNALSRKFLSPLHVASHFGRTKIVHILLLRPGIDINLQDINGDTAMHHASAYGFAKIINKLKDFPGSMNFLTNKVGLTADQENPMNLKLLRTSQEGSAQDVRSVLNKGAICIQDHNGETPLHKAIRSDVDAFVKSEILITHDRKQIFTPSKSKLYPIHLAAKNSDPKVLELLSKECDVNILTHKGLCALHIAIFFGKERNVDVLLKHLNINLTIKDRTGDSVVHFTALKGHTEILDLLLAHAKCQPNMKNNASLTPLHVAVQRKHTKCVEKLLHSKNININSADEDGNTAAHHAARLDHSEILSIIQSDPKYDPFVKNIEGKTADQMNRMNFTLAEVCEFGTAENVKTLLRVHTKLITDTDSRTCLHRACLSDIEPIDKCKLLLDTAPEMINFTDKAGETPLHITCKGSDSKLTTFLLGLPNIDVNIKNKNHEAPLHVTVINNKIENTVALLSHEKVSINSKDARGDTACHIAATDKRYPLLELLQAHPKFDSQIQNNESKTVAEIWSPYGQLIRLPQFTWYEHKSVITGDYFSSMSLIRGHLYCAKSSVVVYNQELEEIGRFARVGDGQRVRQVTGLKNAGLVAATDRDLLHLTLTGEFISRISSGWYLSVTTYGDKLYAVRRADMDSFNIEVYTRGASWQQDSVIQLPCDGDPDITVLATSKAIYACIWNADKIYVVSGDGHLIQTVGREGDWRAGTLRLPILCHSDSTGSIMIADSGNNRLQVLSSEHAFSLVHLLLDTWTVRSAVYIPGRLYVLHKPSLSSTTVTLFLSKMN